MNAKSTPVLSNKKQLLATLEAKSRERPHDPKKAAWDEQIEGLKKHLANHLEHVRKAEHPKLRTKILKESDNMARSFAEPPKDKPLESMLVRGVTTSVASIVDPDIGAARFPDSLEENTALYHSVVQYPIVLDLSVNSQGSFSGVVQPKLGSISVPEQSFIAIPKHNSNNYATPHSFVDSIDGNNPMVDPELINLASCPDSQCSYRGAVDFTSPQNPFDFTNASLTGVNNAGYDFLPAGTYSTTYGLTPIHSAFMLPPGPRFASFQFGWGNDPISWWSGSNWFTAGTFTLHHAIMKHDLATDTAVIFDDLVITRVVGSSSISVTYPTTSHIYYYSGTIEGNSGGVGTNSIAQTNFYVQLPQERGYIYYLSIYANFPTAFPNGDPGRTQVKFFLNVSSSVVTGANPVGACPGAILQRLRPTSQKVHFKCTLSEFNNSGQIALNFMQGGAQETIFSNTGFKYLTFSELSNNNLPMRTYCGALKDGFYGYWVPDNSLDMQLRTLSDSLKYEYPFFAYAGLWTPTGVPSGPTTIGYLRVVTNYEYTTVSRLVSTKAQPGSDAIMQAILSSFSSVPKALENPKHKGVLKSVMEGVTSGFNTVVNFGTKALSIGNSAIGLLDSVGVL